MSTVINNKIPREYKHILKSLKKTEELCAKLESTQGSSLNMEKEGKNFLDAEETLRISKIEDNRSAKILKTAKKRLKTAGKKVSAGTENKAYLEAAQENEKNAEAHLVKSNNRLTDAQNKYNSAEKKFKLSTISEKLKLASNQHDALKKESLCLDNSLIARKHLESFSLLNTVTNEAAQLNAKFHDSTKTPELIVSAQSVDNFQKKGYIKVTKFTLEDYNNNSKKIQNLNESSRWAITAKLPGSLNTVHVITPADITPLPKLSLSEGFAAESKVQKAKSKRLKELRKGIESDSKQLSDARKERKAKKLDALSKGVKPMSYLLYGEQSVDYLKK